MINLVWAALFLVGIAATAWNGDISVVSSAVFQASGDAVTLCLSIAAIMMFWLGFLAVMEASGLLNIFCRLLFPLLRLLFPRLRSSDPAVAPLMMNIGANLLGLGNAATPFGLQAMAELQKRNPDKERASDEMITFLILNTSSLTIIPAMVVGLREAAGSQNPTEIIPLSILASFCGLVAGLILHFFIIGHNRKKR